MTVEKTCRVCGQHAECDEYPVEELKTKDGLNIPVKNSDKEFHMFHNRRGDTFFIHYKKEVSSAE